MANMDRILAPYLKKDLPTKIVLLTGPRQSGKTTLEKMLFQDVEYYNYDLAEDRVALMEKSWRRNCELVIFDELHKLKNWKSWLKGILEIGNKWGRFYFSFGKNRTVPIYSIMDFQQIVCYIAGK